MPSVSVAPLQLGYVGGGVTTIPARVNVPPLALRATMGAVSAGPVTNLSGAVATPKLDRLTRFEQVQRGNEIDPRFQKLWQDNAEATESAFEAQANQINDIAAVVARLEASERLAQAAQATANEASKREALANSYTNPIDPLTANADGSIDIEAHRRIYGDEREANLAAGALSGFVAGDYVSVFYMDAARDGVGVQYEGTTSPIAQAGDLHVIGQVTIPQAGEPPATGGGGGAPGYTPPPTGGGREYD